MRRHRTNFEGKREEGIIVVLVAVLLLFVVGAMAALSIDVVTLYTARSEAQLAADAAALAAARVLANSGTTSDASGASMAAAWGVAYTVALHVAEQNQVGGAYLSSSNVILPAAPGGTISNPTVTVRVQVNSLPTFFARIWGNTALVVAASATAEAYNPSGVATGSSASLASPVAPACVKPWLLPNIDPTQSSTSPIFTLATGASNSTLLGQGWPGTSNPNGLYSQAATGAPIAGVYYPGLIDNADFPAPTQALPACSTGFTPYQLAVAGCVPRPIPCGAPANASINIDTGAYMSNTGSRDSDTVQAAECLIHYNGAAGDTDSIVNIATSSSPPFQFQAGSQNPITGAAGPNVMVSDSLVTVPVYDSSGGRPPVNPVDVIGFLQLFLNPQAAVMPIGTTPPNQIPVTIINMVGCGVGANGTPVFGNGSSPVAVRLITP